MTKASKPSETNLGEEGETGEDDEEGMVDKSVIKLTKVERRAKLKKIKKEAKKQGKELAKTEVEQTPQAAVLVWSLWRFLFCLFPKRLIIYFNVCFLVVVQLFNWQIEYKQDTLRILTFLLNRSIKFVSDTM